MRTIFRLIVLLSILAATGACQSAKSGSNAALSPGSPELDQLYQQGRVAYLDGDYETAAATFARVAAIDPEHLNALINWGVSLSRSGQPKAAIPKFEQALARNPNHAWARYNLGVAWQRLGEHASAVAHYEQAVALNPAILTPELTRYLQRQEPRIQDSQINMQGPPPASSPR